MSLKDTAGQPTRRSQRLVTEATTTTETHNTGFEDIGPEELVQSIEQESLEEISKEAMVEPTQVEALLQQLIELQTAAAATAAAQNQNQGNEAQPTRPTPATPTSTTVGDITKKSQLLPTPNPFKGTEGAATFRRWKRQIEKILKHNANRYNTEAARTAVIYSNLAETAQDYLESFINGQDIEPTAVEMLRGLSAAFDDPLAAQHAR